MGFDRTWLEEQGSEDSHGRTLWALGECARRDASLSRRRWATALFAQALPAAKTFRSPRAAAFTLLGLDAYCAVVPDDRRAQEIRCILADRLMSGLASVETPDWLWFEESLAYDNARLPQALIVTGMATRTPGYVDAGLRSLRWLMTQQTTPAGQFRPVGTASFGEHRKPPRAFDQQPLEATATIAACLAAWRADGDAEWKTTAIGVFSWFLGSNDLSVALVDLRDRQLPRRTASRPCQRKSRRRVGSVLSSGTCRDSSACPRRVSTRQISWRFGPSAPDPTLSFRRTEDRFLHATFLNRQALYLRPDPARVIVRPFKPATEPRDLNPTDKTRANHIVERVLSARFEGRGQPIGGRAGELRGPAPQPAGDVRAPCRRNGRSACGALHFFQSPAPAHRRLFPERVFVRSLGAVQSQHRAAPRPVGDAGGQPALHSQPPRRRRRTRVVADVSRRHRRGRRQHFCRSDRPARFKSPDQSSGCRDRSATKSRLSSSRIRTSANASSFRSRTRSRTASKTPASSNSAMAAARPITQPIPPTRARRSDRN